MGVMMSQAILGTNCPSDDLWMLRSLIEGLAQRCSVDLADPRVVRRYLDGDFPACLALYPDEQAHQKLRTLLILLLRLEVSSSEDLGNTGLRLLWEQHQKILAGLWGEFSSHDLTRHPI
jgi:hypothetical protein